MHNALDNADCLSIFTNLKYKLQIKSNGKRKGALCSSPDPGACTRIVVLYFDHADWHLHINLQHFAARYRDALLRQVDNAIECHIDHSDPGMYINCAISVAPDMDYLSAYRNAVSQILATYRKCLEDIYKQPLVRKLKVAQANNIGGAKWWFRYVIVPIWGSGAVTAVAASLIAMLK